MSKRLQVGLIGAGHFGRYHALKLAGATRAKFIGLADPNPARAKEVAWEAGCPVKTVDEILMEAEAVIIAAPAEFHYEHAARALKAGKHVLVEKPIAATLDQADELITLAQAAGVVLQVGHLERFSAAHGAVSQRMGRALYIEALRIAPFKPRGTDVSVILDLMIHDLDLILTLADSEVVSVDAVGAPVASTFDDIANARIRFASGAVATITASRISLKTERKMRIFSQTGYLTVDFSARKLTLVGRGIGTKVPGFPEFGIEQAGWQDHDALSAEHYAFFASCLDGAKVAVDGLAGKQALAAALMVSKSIAESRAMAEASGLIPQFPGVA
ncbi:Gfo/Idh/MocA family protein [Acidocella aminolytica]|jgi:predicted dehydrogenase|uniref:Oxidoreductase n=1 Tax=Acidocella aminolytica 101 = DSM 11237 TaxID=1120923 RepID=A0A0D6PKP4_9PROT|nr:Gfo/Idh/MocA family oxidoreductase [Acidocella aminolytica]GAN81773.1 oxidoreductase [Acidocella aminolytica 101 = DSM 11237]GBQ37684.1 oxidoreductase [Acidocella aminolytica 101 = DSM 11237]SHE52305.1 Predicted dehydrogenase [Acidocella aminolytica 101 = DSM 11237]